MKALVVPRGYSWAFTIRPNDLREDRLPRDITEGIHWLVSTRYRQISIVTNIFLKLRFFLTSNKKATIKRWQLSIKLQIEHLR